MSRRYDNLERLQQLREKGALSADEFETEKRRLLIRASPPLFGTWIIVGSLALVIAAAITLWAFREPERSQAEVSLPEKSSGNVVTDAAPPPPMPNVKTLPAEVQLARAFVAAFGTSKRATRAVEGSTVVYKPGAIRWIGELAVLVSPGTNSDDCHACAGTLSVHYLESSGDDFTVRGEWLTGGGFDDWGSPPDWRFSTELSQRPMLRTEGGGGNQGIFCNDVTFFEFASGGPRKIAHIPVGYSNNSGLGDDDGTDISGTIRNIRRDLSFEVHYSGTRKFVERWAKRDGRFVLASGSTQMPTC